MAAVGRLLDSGRAFSAIFAANDQMAFGASLGLHWRGLKVPHDVSVVGFDDLPISRFALPPLTTVHHPAYELGQQASLVMLQLLNGEKPLGQVPAPRVIVRQSSRALG